MINSIIKYIRLRFNPVIKDLYAVKHIHPRKLNKRINISMNSNFIYFRVPKAANTTVMRSLVKCDINIDRSEKYDTKSKKKIFYKHPSDLGIKKSINILNKMYVFTFVRNPYDRILSAYLDKVCKHKNNYLAINKKLGRDLNSSISFEDFVEYLDIGGVYDNVHWAPQYSMLPDIYYLNYIGKVEFLNQDLIYLTDILFSNSDSFVLDNYAKNPTHAKNQKETYYTQSLKSKIYELYKQDFHFLGYSKESEGCTQN